MTDRPVARRAARPRRWPWRLALLSAVVLLVSAPVACSTTVIPPTAPADPVPVFIVDYGMTSAVVLPHGDDLLAYAYGDWQYYALANNNVFRGLAALAWPTQGTLGRGRLRGPATAASVMDQVRGRGAEAVHALHVERAAVQRLVERLAAAYAQQQPTEVQNPAYGMSFVHHRQRYTWFWNSNHQTAAWLEELGCKVRGPAFASRWRIRGGDP